MRRWGNVGRPSIARFSNRIVPLVAASLLASCGRVGLGPGTTSFQKPPRQTEFNLVFRYGVGAKNELNTLTETYTRDMVQGAPVTVKFPLSEAELHSIRRKALEINLFDYPDHFAVPIPPGGTAVIANPSSRYYLKVQWDLKTKEVWASDDLFLSPYADADDKARKLRELIKHLWAIIESKEAYKRLPPPRGGYL